MICALRKLARRTLAAPLLTLAVVVAGCTSDAKPTACSDEVGTICTYAGTGHAGFNGDGEALRDSWLYWPVGLTFARDGTAYVLDWNNHKVRRVTEDGTFETVIGTDFVGDGDPAFADLTAPGVPGTEVALNHPTELLELKDGRLLLVSWHNHKLRTYDPTTGLVHVLCGRAAGYAGDGQQASDAATRLNQPSGAALADDGTIYVLDQRNQRIRRIDPSGVIDTIAGNGMQGFAGDGGEAKTAMFRFPTGTNPQPAGTLVASGASLFVSDTLNHAIRRIDLEKGTIETIAGTGVAGDAGDGGPAREALLNNPRGLRLGPDGRLYVADEKNHRVRAIDLASGIIETVAGGGAALGEPGGEPSEDTHGDGGLAVDAVLAGPTGLAFDARGDLYIADTLHHRIRRVRLGAKAPT